MAVLTRNSRWLGVALLSISFMCLVPVAAHVGATWNSRAHPIKNVEANIAGSVVKIHSYLLGLAIGDWRLRDDKGAEHIIDLNSTALTFDIYEPRPEGFARRKHASMIVLALAWATGLALLTAPARTTRRRK